MLLVFVALACTAEELPPVRARSESLVLRSPTDLEICAGTFAMMEAEVVAIRTSFGSAATTIDYSWMPKSHYDADEFPCTTATAWAFQATYGLYQDIDEPGPVGIEVGY